MTLPGLPSTVLPVGELAQRIKDSLEGTFNGIWVVGELSNFTRASSGHLYFSLKDKDAQIKGVMFRFAAMKLRFLPENGLEVIGMGRISYYVPRGDVQIVLEEMTPKGLGAMQLAFEQLRNRLELEGLFAPERKRPLPFLPRTVGVVTSEKGAAIHDIISVMTRRYPNIRILLYPVLVQGDEAPAQIAAGIEALNRRGGIDVMIVGRGGGSAEDLWAFNDERVARAIFASKVPVISAVGHEVDFTIADYVADKRAATPSQAAEIAVPEKAALVEHLRVCRQRMTRHVTNLVDRHRRTIGPDPGLRLSRMMAQRLNERGQRIDDLAGGLRSAQLELFRGHQLLVERAARVVKYNSPLATLGRNLERVAAHRATLLRRIPVLTSERRQRVIQLRQALEHHAPLSRLQEAGFRRVWLEQRLVQAVRLRLREHRERVVIATEHVRTLNPDAMLRRGYSILSRATGKRVVTRASQFKIGELFRVRLSNGTILGEVREIQQELDWLAQAPPVPHEPPGEKSDR